MTRTHIASGLFALIATAACGGGGGGEQPQNFPAAPSGQGTITGRISLDGTAPARQVIRMSSDPMCMAEGTTSEVIVVGPINGLQNVFVYLKGAFDDQVFAAPQTPVVLDQEGCRYVPHVFGVQVGQPVQIVNSDATLHNVHALPKVNQEFNFAQQIKGQKSTRTFTVPEVMVPFRCDVHGWMNAYAGVVPHPFFAVTKADGTFEIKGLPAGTYTLEAWHERLGTQTMSVTNDGTSAATADFTFKPQT